MVKGGFMFHVLPFEGVKLLFFVRLFLRKLRNETYFSCSSKCGNSCANILHVVWWRFNERNEATVFLHDSHLNILFKTRKYYKALKTHWKACPLPLPFEFVCGRIILSPFPKPPLSFNGAGVVGSDIIESSAPCERWWWWWWWGGGGSSNRTREL